MRKSSNSSVVGGILGTLGAAVVLMACSSSSSGGDGPAAAAGAGAGQGGSGATASGGKAGTGGHTTTGGTGGISGTGGTVGTGGTGGTLPVLPDGAPQISQAAFFSTERGPRMIAEGTVPDKTLTTLRLSFYGADGKPVTIDIDGDGALDASSFESQNPWTGGQYFFLENQSATTFEPKVTQIGVEVTDADGRKSNLVKATLDARTERKVGASCDPRGFDHCAAGALCLPVGAAGSCVAESGAAAKRCADASELKLPGATKPVIVPLNGPDLWSAPAGCTGLVGAEHGQGIVRLTLTAAVKELSLSTVNAGTGGDTMLTLVQGCDVSGTIVGCNDDATSKPREVRAKLSLKDLAAGDYVIVIESMNLAATQAELTITTP